MNRLPDYQPYRQFGFDTSILEPDFDEIDGDDAAFIARVRERRHLVSGGIPSVFKAPFDTKQNRADLHHILPWAEHSQPPKGVVPEPRPRPPIPPPRPRPEPPLPPAAKTPPLAMPMVASSVATHKLRLPFPVHVLMSICTPEQFGLLMRKYGMTAEEAKQEFRREVAEAQHGRRSADLVQ